jgi:hypothetical protein
MCLNVDGPINLWSTRRSRLLKRHHLSLLFLLAIVIEFFCNVYAMPFWLLLVGIEAAGVVFDQSRRAPLQGW